MAPFEGSHILIVRSSDPLASRPSLSSDSWRRQFTKLLCPVRVIMGVCCVWKAEEEEEEEEDEGTGGGEGAALITDNHQSIRPQ